MCNRSQMVAVIILIGWHHPVGKNAARQSIRAVIFESCQPAEWIEKFAPPHLLRKRYFAPYWDSKKARVFGYERVSVYGLAIVAKRRVAYDRVDPREAHAIFIAEALVAGRYKSHGAFLEHNKTLVRELRAQEEKLRSTGVLVDDGELARFYEERIPPEISSGAAFEAWRKTAERDDPSRLYLSSMVGASSRRICKDER